MIRPKKVPIGFFLSACLLLSMPCTINGESPKSTCTFGGKVVDENGKPVVAARVLIHEQPKWAGKRERFSDATGGVGLLMLQGSKEAFSDTNGGFEVLIQRDESHVIYLYQEQYVPMIAHNIAMTCSGRERRIRKTFRLQFCGSNCGVTKNISVHGERIPVPDNAKTPPDVFSIEGRTIDINGSPIAGAVVCTRIIVGRKCAETDHDGAFHIGFLGTGMYYLNVRAHSYSTAEMKDVFFQAGDLYKLVVVLQPEPPVEPKQH